MHSVFSRLRGPVVARSLSVVLAAGLALTGLTALWLALAPLPAAAQEVKQGTVIVQFDTAAQMVRPFTFTNDIAGLDALRLSGLEIVTTSTAFGPVVCSIAGVGCPAEDCFCNATRYWAYNAWREGAWQSYAVGAGSSVISQTGAVEGWRWGEFGEAQAPAQAALAAADALTWLAAQQVITDGGYGSAGATVETLLTVGANGEAADDWRRAAASPTLAGAALAAIPAYARGGPAAAGKSAVGLAATGLCLPAIMARPSGFFSPTLGVYSAQSGPNAWAMLGAVALQEPLPAPAAAGLRSQMLNGGGWEWAPGWGEDSNSTALALQALLAAGEPVTATAVTQGVAYLKSLQNTDGGFAYALDGGAPGASDANSTAYAVQALTAAGEDIRSAAWQVGGQGPLDYLLRMQQADGSFAWQAGSGPNLLATQQVIPALLGQTQITAANPAACPAVFLPSIQQ
jgi:hypothetical protein